MSPLKKSRVWLTIAVSSTIWLLAFAPSSIASSLQKSVMQDDSLLLASPDSRRAALDEMQALGVDIVKVGLHWRLLAPDPQSAVRPPVDTANSASYDPGFVASYDSIVQEIQARGMDVWLMPTTPAPNWAAPRQINRLQGVYQPNANLFGHFVRAMASRYQSVHIWSLMNEPNQQTFLQPQYARPVGLAQKAVLSAHHYRKMFKAGHKALVATGHASDRILFGELAPYAGAPRHATSNIRPLKFLREFFCLDDKLKPFRGKAAKARGCLGFSKISASGFAIHPYTFVLGPLYQDKQRDNAQIVHLKRVYRVLDRAAALKRLSRKNMPVYNAEFGFQSYPPDNLWFPIAKIPSFLNVSEYLTWQDPRVATYSQYGLRDDAAKQFDGPVAKGSTYGGFQAGIRFEDGTAKPGVFDAYRLPIYVTRGLASTVDVWGAARTGAGTVEIQAQNIAGIWLTVSSVPVSSNPGYFQQSVEVPTDSNGYWRLKLGEAISRATPASKPVRGSLR